MAYDEGLAIRLLDILGEEAGLAQKKMFGGLAVLVGGNMAVGVYGDDLLVRTDPGQQDMLLAEPGTRLFDMTGRPMKGWIVVDAGMCAEDDDLRRWVSRGVAHARSLPPKITGTSAITSAAVTRRSQDMPARCRQPAGPWQCGKRLCGHLARTRSRRDRSWSCGRLRARPACAADAPGPLRGRLRS